MLKKLLTSTTFKRGFSLIEVLVSLSIFTIVVTISVGSLLVLIDANARARNTQEVMTNLTFTLDSMTRDIRTGSDYYCSTSSALPALDIDRQDCSSGSANGRILIFNEGGQSLTSGVAGSRISYQLNANAIERRLGPGSWVSVTSPNTVITLLRFEVRGSTVTGNLFPPYVVIHVAGYAKDDENRSLFNIQTTVTQQLLDI
jgi:prepilin-type N-terminal cleavage/methylation domain-containing protein